MKIILITHAPPGSLKGNRVTALRWARLFRLSGHSVTIFRKYDHQSCDVLIALHARHSFPSIEQFRRLHPQKPLIVLLTGTDLYKDIQNNPRAHKSLELANHLVMLQPMGIQELPKPFRCKTSVIYQSATAPLSIPTKRKRTFDVCVIGHLRKVKDPFRAAFAARMLPQHSRIRIFHLGQSLEEGMANKALLEMSKNPRYLWLGQKKRWETRKILSASRLMVLSSEMEGGANVISEAVVAGIPVLASYIQGSIGLLGADYPGYFPVRDTSALSKLFIKAEANSLFLEKLIKKCQMIAPQFHPHNEKVALENLLNKLVAGS